MPYEKSYKQPLSKELTLTALREKMQELPEVQAWLMWKYTPAGEQAKIESEWNKYFADVKKSQSFEIYSAMKAALRVGDMNKVAELKTKNQDIRDNQDYLIKPRSFMYDPYWLSKCEKVLQYERVLYKLHQLAIENTGKEDDTLSTQEIFAIKR